MKSSKSEIFYLILSILTLIAGFIIYRTYGTRYTIPHNNIRQETKKASDRTNADVESKVSEFEKNPTTESFKVAQESLNTIENESTKAELQARLDALKTEVDNQTAAEQAVVSAESYQVQYNADVAQTAIDLITNQSVKEELQTRLNTVIANIQAQAATVAPVAPAAVEYIETPSEPAVVQYYE